MKNRIKVFLQKLLGLDTYLFIFSRYIISTLKWNKKEGDFIYFRDMVPDQGNILDIGANIGAMAIHMARTHTNSSILAFEPIPINIKTLKKIIHKYKVKNITVIESALGDSEGTINMVMPVYKSARLHGLSHVLHQSITDNNEGEKYTTPLTTLDKYLTENNIAPVTAIKLDVENYEFFVLKGAVETLKKYKPPVYCELWENKNRDDCFLLMTSLGYKIQVLYKNTLCDYNPEWHKTQNFFFIPV